MRWRVRRSRCQELRRELVSLEGIQTQEAGVRRRHIRRRLAALRNALQRLKLVRTGSIIQRIRARRLAKRKLRQQLSVATWNTRGLGSEHGEIDQEAKMQAILERMRIQGWDVIGLTDLNFSEDGVRKYRHSGEDRFLVVAGRVGFLMTRIWFEWWQEGGGVLYNRSPRVAAIQMPRQGWRRGLFLCCVYAPTSAAGKAVRQAVRSEVETHMGLAAPTSMRVIVGDFNAEMGNCMDRHRLNWEVVGQFAAPRVTAAGEEWRRWCGRLGFRDAGSRYQMRHRWTWRHPRFRTLHELDHVFIHHSDMWHLQQARILQEGPSVRAPWTEYTDHNPMYVKFRVGRRWVDTSASKKSTPKPNLAKLAGAGDEAEAARKRWTEKVEARLLQCRPLLEAAGAGGQWNQLCQICREVSFEVCGVLQASRGSPWMRDRGDALGRLDMAITRAKAADRAARERGLDEEIRIARRELQAARRVKATTLREWEVTWLRLKADEANEVVDKPNAASVFKVVRELTKGASGKRGDGGQRHGMNQQEVEAWKGHFEAIQRGRGDVNPAVWEDVEVRERDRSLDDEPTWEEMNRAINEMKRGKTGGEDGMVAEYLKMGGTGLRTLLFRIVRQCWTSATLAEDGSEHAQWPNAWKVGVIVPLWKKKGDRRNKNTRRGITLLSIGSKLVARICALRLQRWCQSWLNPFQFGFRAGSGVDDVQQVSRRLLEETAQSNHDKTFLLRLYDLEKAYPKVARHALWKALDMKGCPEKFARVLRAIHEGTASKVRLQGFEPNSFVPERGLREGCPSSPILFNAYHHCIMEVFRARRGRQAESLGLPPGIAWTYKVDGRVAKRKNDREDEGRHTRHCVIGDFAYADDTGIAGEATEVKQAEKTFTQTITDFAGIVNEDKTEGLRVEASSRPATDAPWLGEAYTVKHVGAMVSERAGHVAETSRAAKKCVQKIEEISGAWTKGRQIRRRKHDLRKSVRVRVIKAVVKGILMSFSRTRAWQTSQVHRMQNLIHFAIRRVFNTRLRALRQQGITNQILRKMVQWEPFDVAVRRSTLMWLGHVARMSTAQPQKQVLFGWIDTAKAKQRCPFKQAQWVNSCLRQAGIAEIDWLRLSQDRTGWKRLVYTAFPPEKVLPERERELDAWRVGDPIPEWAMGEQADPQVQEFSDSEAELGEQRRGGAQEPAPRPYGRRPRRPRQDRREAKGVGVPICGQTFDKTNQLAFHYETEHSIRDPNITTVQSFRCSSCFVSFRRSTQLKAHNCPAKSPLERLSCIDPEELVGGPDRGTAEPLPDTWHLFTDGSGGSGGAAAHPATAGWGVAVYGVANPSPDLPWLAALYGPVCTGSYDPV